MKTVYIVALVIIASQNANPEKRIFVREQAVSSKHFAEWMDSS